MPVFDFSNPESTTTTTEVTYTTFHSCLLYTSQSPRDSYGSRMAEYA